ncbi:MAG: chitobiase/beta-hexosaminidase C-terminal domain-containing protein [Actinomycetota bacterium]
MKRKLLYLLVLVFSFTLVACGGGGDDGNNVTTGTVSAPTFTPAPGSYIGAQSIALSTTSSGASIRYTVDGSIPTSSTATLYSAPIPVSSSTTIKAIAYKTGWIDSPIATGTYTITPPVDNSAINTYMSSGNSLLIFLNNILENRIDASGPVQAYPYLGPAGGYKLILLPNVNTAGSHPLSFTDTTDNNVFNLQAGGVLNILGGNPGTYIGNMETNVSGSGFNTAYEAPMIMSGTAWNLQTTVYDSRYDNGAVFIPVGTEDNSVRTLSQNGFQVTYASSLFSTCYGTVNGNLVYFWSWGGNDPTWLRTHSETWVVDPSGTSLTGTMEDTWQARSGSTTAYVRANVVGWR